MLIKPIVLWRPRYRCRPRFLNSLIIADSTSRALLAIYHLISNVTVRSWNNCYCIERLQLD